MTKNTNRTGDFYNLQVGDDQLQGLKISAVDKSEENVWHLCSYVQKNIEEEVDRCYCVFISNPDRTIPLWCQKSSSSEQDCVVWDYHVIFVYKGKAESLVYDLDTTMDFPCDFNTYAKDAIRPCDLFKPNYHRLFRIVKATDFLSTFASDRSHMLNDNNEWLQPPPSYPCIQTDQCTNNIQEFIAMDRSSGAGTVTTFRELCDMFQCTGDENS